MPSDQLISVASCSISFVKNLFIAFFSGCSILMLYIFFPLYVLLSRKAHTVIILMRANQRFPLVRPRAHQTPHWLVWLGSSANQNRAFQPQQGCQLNYLFSAANWIIYSVLPTELFIQCCQLNYLFSAANWIISMYQLDETI